MNPLFHKLESGDRRSIGRSEEVVADVLKDATLFDVLAGGLSADDAIVRMRAADAMEKISAIHPEYLHPHKKFLIALPAESHEKEVRKRLSPSSH